MAYRVSPNFFHLQTVWHSVDHPEEEKNPSTYNLTKERVQ